MVIARINYHRPDMPVTPPLGTPPLGTQPLTAGAGDPR